MPENKHIFALCVVALTILGALAVFYKSESAKKDNQNISVDVKPVDQVPPQINITTPPPTVVPPPQKKWQLKVWPFVNIENTK